MTTFADRFPTQPRQWAVVGHYRSWNAAQVAASNLRTGKVNGVEKGRYRIKAKRTTGDGYEAIVVARREA